MANRLDKRRDKLIAEANDLEQNGEPEKKPKEDKSDEQREQGEEGPVASKYVPVAVLELTKKVIEETLDIFAEMTAIGDTGLDVEAQEALAAINLILA
jgi:hypothetical protein